MADDVILVTGASGFIGSHLCRHLRGNGRQVHALQRAGVNSTVPVDVEPANRHLADLQDRGSLARLFCGALAETEAVFHCAGIAHVEAASENDLHEAIVDATNNLLQAAVAAKVKKFVFLSSALAAAFDPVEPVGAEGPGAPGETTRPGTAGPALERTAYGRCKWQAEQLLLGAHRRGEIQVAILRPVNVYGPGMKGNIASLARLIRRGRIPPLPRLTNRVSLLGVEDLCKFAAQALQRSTATGPIPVLTDGQAYSVSQIEQSLYQALGRKKPDWHVPRVVFYAAAALAELASRLGLARSGIGMRTYRNLTRDSYFPGGHAEQVFAYKPENSLEDLLPAIIKALE